MEKPVLRQLRRFAKSSRMQISDILTEAVSEYLDRRSVRPIFRDAVDEVLRENKDLLERLAK